MWPDEVLETARRTSVENFVRERTAQGGQQYLNAFHEDLTRVTDLFEATNDLLDLATGSALADAPVRVQIARYLSGPPVSADDLDTLAEANIAKRKRLDTDLATRAANIIRTSIDRERFPWMFADPPRQPTANERETAMRWTAGLHAAQRVQTARRGESAMRQELAVEELLTGMGFVQVTRRPITITGGLGPGEFCRESLVEGTKCDVPVGLRDGRFLFLECKVSNSAANSVKRLNREVGGKARDWSIKFGQRAITGAVLAGVFKLRNLQSAQEVGVAIYWEHSLGHLREFLEKAC
jgi:hypothetical protein